MGAMARDEDLRPLDSDARVTAYNAVAERDLARRRAMLPLAGVTSRTLSSATLVPVASAPSGSSGMGATTPRGSEPKHTSTTASLGGTGHASGLPRLGSRVARSALRSADLAEESVETGEQSFLEQRSIKSGTAAQYRAHMVLFLAYATTSLVSMERLQPGSELGHSGLDALPGDLADGLATDYLDKLYFEGALAGDAEKLRASIIHFCLRLAAHGLPRLSRALRGFRKLSRAASRFRSRSRRAS